MTETYPPEINGVALTLAHLVNGLRQQGHTVSVVRPRQQNFDGRSCSDDPAVTLVPSLPLPGYKGLQVGLPAGGVLRRCWTRHRPEVVYVATEGPLGWSAVRVARQLGIPIFSGFHTNFHSYTEHYHLGRLRLSILRYLCEFHNRTIGTVVASADLRDRLQNHTPVAARVVDIYESEGSYHSCHPEAVIALATPFSKNKRVVTVIDTDTGGGTGVGLVAMIEVVALMIGDIVQCYSETQYLDPHTVQRGMFLRKGCPKSLYRPGSSTTVLLFQENRVDFAPDLLRNLHR